MNPAAQGLAWSTTGGTLVGSTYTGTAAGGPFKVKVQSVEDPTKVAEASVMVQSVSVAVPTTSIPVDQLFVGTPLTCSALVSGASVSTVTWSITGGQTIHPSTGLFTPTAPGSYTVTATSTCDPTKSASALLVVKALQVAVSPAQATVKSGQIQAFTATVTGYGSPSQAVTWRVDGVVGGNSTVGTISASGVYTAPAASGDHVISAVSQQDPAGLGSAALRVPGWRLKWVKDIVYVGTKEVAEVSPTGTQIAFVDHLGSPRYLWDGQPPAANKPDGVHLLEQKFMPFGESLTHPADASKIAKGFTNHEQTEANGLIYMQARFYAPWFGRFMSPDPKLDQHFQETQSWNIYSYVQNMPTRHLDPTGETLTVAGDANTIKQFKQVLNSGLNGLRVHVDSKGHTTLQKTKTHGKVTQRQAAMEKELRKVIDHKDDVKVTLSEGSKTVVGSYETSDIDMKDVKALGNGPGATAAGALVHEISEQFSKQVNGKAYPQAHADGISSENAVNGSTRGPQAASPITGNPDGTVNLKVTIPYQEGTKKTETTIEIDHNNVKKVERN